MRQPRWIASTHTMRHFLSVSAKYGLQINPLKSFFSMKNLASLSSKKVLSRFSTSEGVIVGAVELGSAF